MIFKIAGILLFTGGCAMFLWSVVSLRRAFQSVQWATVRGEIIDSKVRRYRNRTKWDWNVQYRYTVDCNKYEGTRAYFGSNPRISLARSIVAKFPTGTMADIYYHPTKPAMSVLIPGPNAYTYSAILIGPCSWLMAMFFWFIH